MNTIGSRIKARREGMGLSQIDLAASAGIKQGTLSDIEKGVTQNMRVDSLFGLCRELRLTPEYIFYGTGISESAEVEAMEAEVLLILRSLTAGQRDGMLGMARGLYQQAQGKSEPVVPAIQGSTPEGGQPRAH